MIGSFVEGRAASCPLGLRVLLNGRDRRPLQRYQISFIVLEEASIKKENNEPSKVGLIEFFQQRANIWFFREKKTASLLHTALP